MQVVCMFSIGPKTTEETIRTKLCPFFNKDSNIAPSQFILFPHGKQHGR